MLKIKEELQNLFGQSLDPLDLSFHFNGNEYEDFECIYSTQSEYKKGDHATVYQIEPLMRVLALKRKLLSSKLEEEIFKEDVGSLCFILEWTDHARKIVIFNLKNLRHFDSELFINTIEENNLVLLDLFQKIYFHSQGAL